jgi:2,3-bisphosphoglycerate-independent phosphoglycerate mutase
MRILLLVMDGAGDTGKGTPLSLARKPAMDGLARRGRVGLLDMGYGKVASAESDVGYLSLLGCFSKATYPGRGYLEALAFPGLRIREGDVCIRANFATLDREGTLQDRRAGRDETGLDGLAGLLDGMEIDGVRFLVRRLSGHRVLIVMRGQGLSDAIVPNDPKRTGVPLPQVGARGPQAKRTASTLNRFLYRAHGLLSRAPENGKRGLAANAVLIRNAGMRKDSLSLDGALFASAAGRPALQGGGCCIAGVPIAWSVARFLGMDVIRVKGATGMPETNLRGKFDAAGKALRRYGLVFLHVNGTDILSHDRKPDGKRRMIEAIDAELGRLLEGMDLGQTIVIVTCDHRTASSPDWKGYEHLDMPVPVLIAGGGVAAGGEGKFDEASCERGFVIRGNALLGFALSLAGGRAAGGEEAASGRGRRQA